MGGGVKLAEVRVVLNTDIKQAQNQLKRFEQDLKRMQELKNKGGKSGGFLDSKDTEEFKRLNKEMTKNYTEYVESMRKNTRDINREIQRISELAKNTASKSEQNAYNRQLESLKRQKRMIDESVSSSQASYGLGQQTASEVGTYGSSTFMALGKLGAMLTVLTLGISKLISSFQAGYEILNDGERRAYQVAQKTGQYGSDYGKLRDEAYQMGYDNAYTARQTLETMGAYTSKAGVTNVKQVQKDVVAMQDFSRAYAIDPNTVAGTIGGLSRRGVGQEGEQRRLANLIAVSIKKQGMSGREEEFLRTTESLADAVSATQAGLTTEGLASTLKFQEMLVSSNPALKGEAGANIVKSMNSSITGGDNMMDILLGKGDKYIGPEGMWQLKIAKEQGLSNPENMKSVMSYLQKYYGGNEDVAKLMLSQTFGGLPSDVVENLWGQRQAIASGSLSITEKDIDKLQKEGAGLIQGKKADYDASKLKTREQWEAQKEEVQATEGKVAVTVTDPVKAILTGVDVGALTSLKVLGIAGGTALGTVGLAKMFPALLKKILPTVGEAGATGATAGATASATAGANTGARAILQKAGTSLSKAGSGLGRVGSSALSGTGKALSFVGSKLVPKVLGGLGVGVFADVLVNASPTDSSEFDTLVSYYMENEGLSKADAEAKVMKAWGLKEKPDGSHASGISRVPKNNYRAILHKDEAVLNPYEANSWRNSKKLVELLNKTEYKTVTSMEAIRDTLDININVSGNVGGLDETGNIELTQALKDTFNPKNTQLMELLAFTLTRRVG